MLQEEITTIDMAEAVRKLADYVEAASEADGSVVCFIRLGDQTRLYAIGDDLADSMVEAAVALEASIKQANATHLARAH